MTGLSLTLWPSLYRPDEPEGKEASWEEVVSLLSRSRQTDDKLSVPGFTPAPVVSPPAPCHRHKGAPRTGPHRCDLCVEELHMMVFDVDQGTVEQIEECDNRLSGTARVWYSSHSYDPQALKPSLRLVIPLASPVPAPAWRALRLSAIRQYAIPCDPRQCSGLSHFYFLPSHRPGTEPLFEACPGEPLDWKKALPPPAVQIMDREVFTDWTPHRAEGVVDLAPYRERLSSAARSLASRSGPADREKARILRAVLAGKPLAEKGARNVTLAKAAGLVAWRCADAPVEALVHLLRPSVEAMAADGSRVTLDVAERQVLSALRKKAEDDAKLEALRARMEGFVAGLPRGA